MLGSNWLEILAIHDVLHLCHDDPLGLLVNCLVSSQIRREMSLEFLSYPVVTGEILQLNPITIV